MRNKKLYFYFVITIIILVGLTGCSNRNESVMPPASPDIGYYADTSKGLENETADGRKVISNGNLSLSVDDLGVAQEEVLRILNLQEGYIQSSYFNNVEGQEYWEFTLRIPSLRFAETIDLFSDLGKVRTVSTSEQDVTEEYIDLDARLNVLHQEEGRLLELLKIAVTMDDFLKVEENLSRVRVDIEQTTGRLRYFDSRIDFATLTLSLHPDIGTVEPELKGFAGLGKRIANAFKEGLNLFVDLVAGTMVFVARSLPVLVVLALALYFAFGLVVRIRRKK